MSVCVGTTRGQETEKRSPSEYIPHDLSYLCSVGRRDKANGWWWWWWREETVCFAFCARRTRIPRFCFVVGVFFPVVVVVLLWIHTRPQLWVFAKRKSSMRCCSRFSCKSFWKADGLKTGSCFNVNCGILLDASGSETAVLQFNSPVLASLLSSLLFTVWTLVINIPTEIFSRKPFTLRRFHSPQVGSAGKQRVGHFGRIRDL